MDEERRERRIGLAIVATCLAVVAIGWLPRLPVRPPPPVPESPDMEVAVHGEVLRPGRYVLPFGARVGDLIEAAGGTTVGAATELVDLVAPLADGRSVHVPARAAEEGSERVSINEATPRQLETLPGIGPALAARIVAARPFHAVADLERVRGIGPATLRRLRDLVTL